MTDPSIEKRKQQIRIREWKGIVSEILKWGIVIWLLFPLTRLTAGRFMFMRVLLGILLFIIFAGKRFYDTVIMSAIKQRRTSLKEDMIAFLGMVLGATLLVGLVIFLFAMLIVTWQADMAESINQVN